MMMTRCNSSVWVAAPKETRTECFRSSKVHTIPREKREIIRISSVETSARSRAWAFRTTTTHLIYPWDQRSSTGGNQLKVENDWATSPNVFAAYKIASAKLVRKHGTCTLFLLEILGDGGGVPVFGSSRSIVYAWVNELFS